MTRERKPGVDATYFVSVKPLIPYLYIWGSQWVISAMLDYIWNMNPQDMPVRLSAVLALILSAAIWLRQRRQYAAQGLPPLRLIAVLFPALLLIGSVALLIHVEAVAPYYVHLFRSLILAFYYVQFGVFYSKHLVFLGLWLFALTAVLSIWYLGYAPMILSAFGGISMICAAWMLHMTNKTQMEGIT